jgi:hypothetical protein
MIDLIDAVQGLIEDLRVEHGTQYGLHARHGTCPGAEVENAHASSSRGERRNEVLADEAAATSDEYTCHLSEYGSF